MNSFLSNLLHGVTIGRFLSRHEAWRRVRTALLPLALLGLSACGGGTPQDDLPSRLSASQAVQMLTTSPKTYPAALAVRVTTTSTDVQVRGVQRVGGAALRGDEAFPMGSITKSMTATLAGVLVQEGRIAWTSRIVDVLPELAPLARSEYAAVTLKDLLAHRGGLFPATTAEQIAQLPALSGTPTEQRLQLGTWMLRRASSSQPTAKTQYSNGDYIMAGAMLERAAGQPYETALQAKVFAPIGQVVRFGAPGLSAGEPWGHAAGSSGTWQPIDPASPDAEFPSVGNPAGGAKLSGAAWARYLQMHLRAWRGVAGEVISPAAARTLHAIVQDGFALGWEEGKDLEGRDVHWHNGSDDASYYSLMVMSLTADAASGVVITGYGAKSEADASEATVRVLR